MFHPLTKAISLLALAILGLAMDTPSNSVVNSVHDTTPMKWHQTWVPTGKIEFKVRVVQRGISELSTFR